jgi:hypothetical protein
MNMNTFFGLLDRLSKSVLQVAALILSIINGLMLLRFYLRDRAIVTVGPIHPEVYQWWFALPPGNFEGKPTRRYGFIAYVGFQNCGLRKTQMTAWRLSIRAQTDKYARTIYQNRRTY